MTVSQKSLAYTVPFFLPTVQALKTSCATAFNPQKPFLQKKA
jgi:hypothetical protein